MAQTMTSNLHSRSRSDEKLAFGIIFGAIGAAAAATTFVLVAPALPKTQLEKANAPGIDLARDVAGAVEEAQSAIRRADASSGDAEAVLTQARAQLQTPPADFGQTKLRNGSSYLGQMRNGSAEGVGMGVSDGRGFEAGFYVDGARNGPGVQCAREDCSGQAYFGDFRGDVASGVGRIGFASGTIYRGEVRAGVPEGFGEYVSADKWVYRGSFRAGKRNGHGELVDQRGARLAGWWVSDRLIDTAKPE